MSMEKIESESIEALSDWPIPLLATIASSLPRSTAECAIVNDTFGAIELQQHFILQ